MALATPTLDLRCKPAAHKAKPMRRIMTALAIVWLASAGVMATLQISRTAASAAVMSSPKVTSP
jgi:hypothetical protein